MEANSTEPEGKTSELDFGFDVECSLDLSPPKVIPEPEPEPEPKANSHRVRTKATCLVRKQKNIYRRAFSETQLMDAVGHNFKNGESYHCLTGGDVDALSYLKVVLRQQNLKHCLFSTWCMAMDDVLQLEEWVADGKIKRLDAYVGEIFTAGYVTEFEHLKRLTKKTGGRICVFRNHSKTFAGYGKKFYFGIETSANINTNPRVENGCITIGKDIYEFYNAYYSKIVSFEKDGREKRGATGGDKKESKKEG